MIVILLTIVRKITIIISKEEQNVQSIKKKERYFYAYAPIEKKENNITGLNYSTPARNVPHCPTCGSENVTKISLGSKAVGGAMFGIFSSNIRKSYKCNNCGYKW